MWHKHHTGLIIKHNLILVYCLLLIGLSSLADPLRQIQNLPMSTVPASEEILIEYGSQIMSTQCDVLKQGKENIGK